MLFKHKTRANERAEQKRTLMAEADALRGSVFFDADWYCDTYSDLKGAVPDPLFHFVEHGWREGRNPHPLFNTEWYLNANPDVRRIGLNPLFHYEHFGKQELRSPNRYFDVQFYLKQHPGAEVRHDPFGHYHKHGQNPGHDPNPYFDNGWYASRNELGSLSALDHFIRVGEDAGLSPHPLFDVQLYLASNPDLRRSIANKQIMGAYRHFIENGRHEIAGRHYTRRLTFPLGKYLVDFLEAEYLEDNADARHQTSIGQYRTGIEHFFAKGHKDIDKGMRPVYGRGRFPKVISVSTGGAPAGKNTKLCLFAHYDEDNVIHDYIIVYLKSLRAQGFDIHFITATGSSDELDKIRGEVTRIIVKNDAGRDFGSWYLAYVNLVNNWRQSYSTVLLANDSIYFPVIDPSIMFKTMELYRYDFWGITDSRDWSFGQYHIQSFFLAFEQKAIDVLLPRVMELVRQRPVLTKRGQIVDFEIGFSEIALNESLSVGAFCGIDDIREDVIRDTKLVPWRRQVQMGLEGLNSTLDIWDLLVRNYSCPMLKVQLLRENPRELENVKNWTEYVDPSFLPHEDIKSHLDRSLKPKASSWLTSAAATSEDEDIRVIEVLRGEQNDSGRDLVLFAHYDPDGIADDHILASIRGFKAAGCDVATITATTIPGEIEKLRRESNTVVIKSSGGRDFGSWFAGINALKQSMPQYHDVIWVNDSSYFPLFDPNEMFDAMRARKLDFWGVVDSHNLRWHVMSWFWAFNRRIREDGWFEWYQGEYNAHYQKWGQIRNYEMRVPLMLRAKGYACDSYIKAEDVLKYITEERSDHPRATRRMDFTMTHEFWDIIIERFRCPALKVELLRDNPLGMDLSTLYSVVAKTEYDPALIRSHIGRINMKHLGLK